MVASSLFVDFEVFEKDATAGIDNVKINKTIKIITAFFNNNPP